MRHMKYSKQYITLGNFFFVAFKSLQYGCILSYKDLKNILLQMYFSFSKKYSTTVGPIKSYYAYNDTTTYTV